MRRLPHLVNLLVLSLALACSKGSDSPTAPTTTPPTTATRIINISGTLAFGDVVVGQKATATFTISNSGNSALTITGINATSAGAAVLAASFTSGTIAPGASQSVTMQFAPVAAISYSGSIRVVGDQTAGNDTLSYSGAGAASSLIPLVGVVTAAANGSRISGATVKILDGPNAGKTTTTSNGDYRFDSLAVGNANLSVNASGFDQSIKGVFIDGNNTLNFALLAPPFSMTGTGDSVFTIPSTVSRIRITAHYAGNSSNFIVKIGSSLVVNELVGTFWGQVDFSGTYLTIGGVVQVTNSSGVSWTFTEVR